MAVLRARPLLAALALLPAGVRSLSAEMQATLDKHNVYRCMHGIPAFTWDSDIAANAQAWADNGDYKHSSSASRVVNGEQCGENLAMGYPSLKGDASTVMWYSEIEFTEPYGVAASFQDSKPAGNAIGHYTQVVWKNSVKLGCGKGTTSSSMGDAEYWVCQYGPAGNYGGQFPANVLAPTKTAVECGGSSGDVPTVSGESSGGGSTELPSSCTPSTPLPVGSLCAYGHQCESSFCCPRMKCCLADSSSGISSADLQVEESMKASITEIVFTGGGTCADPWSNVQKCLQTSAGQPLSGWDQSQCGCKEEYMSRYREGTWVSLNTGATCIMTPSAGAAPVTQPDGVPQRGTASAALRARGELPGALPILAVMVAAAAATASA